MGKSKGKKMSHGGRNVGSVGPSGAQCSLQQDINKDKMIPALIELAFEWRYRQIASNYINVYLDI